MKKIILILASFFVAGFCFAGAGNTVTSSSLSGTVLDAATKKPLADVTIVATSSTKNEHVITTDANGNYKVTNLPEGTYKIRFSKEDYTSEKKEVSVKAQHTTKLNIELDPETVDEINSRRSWWDKFDIFL